MERIHLASALVIRGDDVLLVASRYPSHVDPLWNLPGGRQGSAELLDATALRELREETGLIGRVRKLAYLAESYDGERSFINAVFRVEANGKPRLPARGDHVTGAIFVPRQGLREYLAIAVVREPLLAFLRDGHAYTGFAQAGVSVRWE